MASYCPADIMWCGAARKPGVWVDSAFQRSVKGQETADSSREGDGGAEVTEGRWGGADGSSVWGWRREELMERVSCEGDQGQVHLIQSPSAFHRPPPPVHRSNSTVSLCLPGCLWSGSQPVPHRQRGSLFLWMGCRWTDR